MRGPSTAKLYIGLYPKFLGFIAAIVSVPLEQHVDSGPSILKHVSVNEVSVSHFALKLAVHSLDLCFQFGWTSYTVSQLVDIVDMPALP